jgi:hypothetical protein
VAKLRKYDPVGPPRFPDPGSGCWFCPSRIPDTGFKRRRLPVPVPGYGSATLLFSEACEICLFQLPGQPEVQEWISKLGARLQAVSLVGKFSEVQVAYWD